MKNLSNKIEKKTIVFFSNPFGYGPTGTLIPIVKTFVDKLKNTRFIFAGSGLSKEIWDKNTLDKIEFVELDERNYDAVKEFLSSFSNIYIVCVLNKFVTKVASELGLECALVDPLGWFWTTQMPSEFMGASIYFPNNFNKKLPTFTKTYNTPLIVGTGRNHINNKNNKDLVILHLGGSQYPVASGISTDYLNLIATLVNELNKNIKRKLIIAGGKSSTDYLQSKVSGIMKTGSFSLVEFNEYLDNCKNFVTLAGMGATFTAISKRIPTSILLPQNLSQLALTNVLKEMSIIEKNMDWNKYSPLPNNILDLTESEGILLINKLAKKILNSPSSMEIILTDFQDLFDFQTKAEQSKQILNIEFGGEKFIFNTLAEEWQLSC